METWLAAPDTLASSLAAVVTALFSGPWWAALTTIIALALFTTLMHRMKL